MSDQLATATGFANKKEKPTTKEYLNADFEAVLDRLNKNPSSQESEASFIDAVITVRHAKIIERLNRRLVLLTGIAAVATAALVFVPFFDPSLEAQRLEARIGGLQEEVNAIKADNKSLREELPQQKHAVSVSSSKSADLSARSVRAAPVQMPAIQLLKPLPVCHSLRRAFTNALSLNAAMFSPRHRRRAFPLDSLTMMLSAFR